MKFFSLTKPGIIFGNLITACGGFFLASQGDMDYALFLFVLLGVSLVVASGCVLNNYIDRDIDKLMVRTKNRALVQGTVSGSAAIAYAALLGALGVGALYFGVNRLTTLVALLGLFFYVVVYSLWLKRNSTSATLIGGISGAVPPMIGYLAVTNHMDAGAIILFFILFFWQVPHAYAIAVYRLEDYSAASIPVLPVKQGVAYTQKIMLFYIVAFTVAAIMPYVFSYAGIIYVIVAGGLGLMWFGLGLKGFLTENPKTWARKMFIFSIINITLICMMMLFPAS